MYRRYRAERMETLRELRRGSVRYDSESRQEFEQLVLNEEQAMELMQGLLLEDSSYEEGDTHIFVVLGASVSINCMVRVYYSVYVQTTLYVRSQSLFSHGPDARITAKG